MISTKDRDGGTVLDLSVQPKASRETVGETEQGLKVWLTLVPESGKANKRLLKVLSKILGVPPSSLEILTGGTSKKKAIFVLSRSGEQVVEKIRQFVDSGKNI